MNTFIILMIAATITIPIWNYYKNRKKRVPDWMKNPHKIKRYEGKCTECGGDMERRKRLSGVQEGREAIVCTNFPQCRNVKYE
jgi:ssDNA-binding Zn-finger/Zn-ribbon topoisomerase 1